MTLARKLHPSTVTADRQHASLWDDTDMAWLQDHDGEAHYQRGYPDPTGDAAVARADRERRRR